MQLRFIKNNFTLLFGLGISLLIIFAAVILRPELTGDGQEYYLMLESIYNHQSPELTAEDINSFDITENLYGFKYYRFDPDNAYSGYFQSDSGYYYSYHFWGYSLINLPVKIVLEILKVDPLKTFQITNALFLSLLIIAISRLKSLSQFKKFILQALLIFNPILWFIFWSHPELFTYVVVTLSLLMLLNRRFSAAIFLSAIASMQNPPLIVIPVSIFMYKVYLVLRDKVHFKTKLKNIYLSFIAAIVTLIPFIFYYINFNTLNLIAAKGGSDFKLISIQRITELFIDLNIGIATYIPVIFLISISIIGYLFYKGTRKDKGFILLASAELLIILALSTTTLNWNHGTTGPSRYTLWSILPFMFMCFYLVLQKFNFARKVAMIFFVGITINILIILSAFLPGVSLGATSHSYLSKFILNYLPSIYNPTIEIFAERTLTKEDIDLNSETPIFRECKKALVSTKNSTELLNQCPNMKVNYCLNSLCYYSAY